MDSERLNRLLAAARGDAPADLVLRNARLVNVASGEIYETGIAIRDGYVIGLGDGYTAREGIDLNGRYVCPGLIDAHVHVESAMVPPAEFARMVLPRGVTAAVTDPHEIANVCGLPGIRFMLREGRRSPLALYVNASSCVPATRLGTAGATLAAADLAQLRDEPEVIGLAEVMDFPAVVAGESAVLAKLEAFRDLVIDGHCPGLTGAALNAYATAGILSDHECTTVEEAREKLRLGMTIFIREATGARNLDALLPLITPENERRICLCTDDRQVPDLTAVGSVDHMVRRVIAAGIDPVAAIRMVTLNPATYFGLRDRGVVAPGRVADFVVVEDLREFAAERVFVAGKLVAADGRVVDERRNLDPEFTDSVNLDPTRLNFEIPAQGSRVRAIRVVPDQLVTEGHVMDAHTKDGFAVANPDRDLLKMAVIERHTGSGRVGLGFVKGMGLRQGAIAGTVAHDHHNLVVIGADDVSMRTAAKAVIELRGGLAVAKGDSVQASLPLPIAGLMSPLPFERVGEQLEAVIRAARDLGSPLHDPFMAMSFLALEVIPALKLTDLGIVDITRMETVSLFVTDA